MSKGNGLPVIIRVMGLEIFAARLAASDASPGDKVAEIYGPDAPVLLTRAQLTEIRDSLGAYIESLDVGR
jgi:hypothetical protein